MTGPTTSTFIGTTSTDHTIGAGGGRTETTDET